MYTYKKAPMRNSHGRLDPIHLSPTPFNFVGSHVVKKDRDGGLEVFKNQASCSLTQGGQAQKKHFISSRRSSSLILESVCLALPITLRPKMLHQIWNR